MPVSIDGKAQEDITDYLPDLAQGRVDSFYRGVALASMFAVLVAMLWRARQQNLHVTQLKRQSEQVRTDGEREKRLLLSKLQIHYDNTPTAVIELDAARRFRQWSGRAEAIFGWRAMEVVGQSYDVLPWIDAEGQMPLRETFAGTGGAEKAGRIVTMRHLARDGSIRMIEWHVSVQSPGDGEPETVLALGMDVTDRASAAAEVNAGHERYMRVAQAAGTGVWTLDPTAGNLLWEPHLAEMLGYSSADFPARLGQWLDLMHADDRPQMEELLQVCAREPGMTHVIEARLRHRDGSPRWFRLSFVGLKVAAGLPLLISGTATDLTRMKLAEQKFLGLMEQSLAGIFILQENRVVYANPKFWAIARLGGSRPPSRPEFLELVHPDDRATVAARLRPLYAGEAGEAPLLFRLAGPHGHTVAVQGHGIASEHEGEPAILGMVMDASHRFAQEQTSRRLSQVVEQSPVGIMITDPAGTIEYVNQKFCEVSGYRQEELLGQTPRLLKSGEMPEEFYRELWNRLEQGKKWEGEFSNRTKDGRNVMVRANLFPVFDEAGLITHYVEIMEDITSQRALEERLARAQRLESIGNLAGGIAHDLNNILAPVRLGAGFLKTLPFAGKEREIIEVMDISIHRASELVQQVLAFSRGRRGKREIIAPGNVIVELERLVRETFPRDVRLDLQVAQNLWLVKADPTQFLQVLMNLCVNSRDAMPAGGVITLVADNVVLTGAQTSAFPGARPGPHVRVRVSDMGTGIPVEALPKIFEPFFTTKDVGKGTGLGLSTALSIVQDHAGIMEIESTGPQGTTFVLYLPAQPEGSVVTNAPADSSAPEAESSLAAGNGTTILVVDDEAPLRQAIAFVLKQRGYVVVEAADGYQAVEKLRERSGDVAAVVLDVMMPRLDGVATLKALRELRPDLRVIATSGVRHDTRIEALRKLGVTQFLLKPYRNHELMDALHECLTGKN